MKEDRIQVLRDRVKDVFSDYSELAGGKNYRYHHSVRVLRISSRIKGYVDERVDKEVLAAGALLHDIGRKEDIEDGFLDPFKSNEGHAEKGREKVEDFAGDLFSEDEIGRIKVIVSNHHSTPETVEGRIVKDSDRLDVYGVSNLWRMFHYSYENGRVLEDEEDYFWNEAVPDMKQGLEKFFFRVSRRTAEKRLGRLVDAFNYMMQESHGADISKSI